MEILYYIINFLILVALIVLVGRKTIISIFKTRKEKIESSLNEAERPVSSFDEEADETEIALPEGFDSEVRQIRDENDKKINRIKTNTTLECKEITLSKLKRERKKIIALFTESVKRKYAEGGYCEAEKIKNAKTVEDILSTIKLTPGDMSYLQYHDVLYVTLSSAYPIEEELVEKVRVAAEELVSSVGGKISFWVKQNPELIGGLSLRIGDTVYDGTVAEHVYHVKKSIYKLQMDETDNVDTLLVSLSEEVLNPKLGISVYQLGRVISVSDGICWMDGLADSMYGELLEFEGGERGMVLDVQKEKIGCVILGDFEHIESYTKVRRVGIMASVPVGDGLLGRVVNAIGEPIDGKSIIRFNEKRPIESPAPGILDRKAVCRPLHTGIKAIDSMIPIGKGQRELIIGDRQTGKSSIVIDTILNQKGKDVICIYVGIGQKETSITDMKERLEHYGALDYTVIVVGSASESAAMQYVAPFAATAMAEHFMHSGKDVLIIYDDLSKHAVAYRELSLLLQRPSGREAYPGDIFYLHSRLLERSAQLSDEMGGGSITALPIIETQAGDISSYIPTNVISITDGQVFLESELFHAGQRPAVNVGLSVSRVGGAAQTKLMKQVSSDLRTKLAQYRELAEFTQFGSDVDDITKSTLNSGEHLTEALKQSCNSPLEDYKQAVLLFAVSKGFTDNIPVSMLSQFEKTLFERIESEYKDLTEILKTGKKMDEEVIKKLSEAVSSIVKEF